jgi:hypothetical protein
MPKIIPPMQALEEFSKFKNAVFKNSAQMTPVEFSKGYRDIQKNCLPSLKRDVFCREAEKFASELVENKSTDFAGIIMSSLCKLTDFYPQLQEGFAIKGYHIARANGDILHEMARLNDLRKIYYQKPDRVKDYIGVMYAQEGCLKQLVYNYDSAVSTYHSIQRTPASQKEYKTMLAFVQTELAKLTKRKHPVGAMNKLVNAREIFVENNNKQSVQYIDMLLGEIRMQLKVQKGACN